jgi:hypothetical protein
VKQRRVLFGWAPEADAQSNDLARGWASVMALPRTITLDPATGGTSLLVYPVEELQVCPCLLFLAFTFTFYSANFYPKTFTFPLYSADFYSDAFTSTLIHCTGFYPDKY